ncbi:MAG TPA: nuclear transport factor 2 family protein [Pyrinomonadaceae bacterium]
MKKPALIFSIIAVFSISAFAQKADDSKDALAVVNKMFAEMAAHNPAGIVALYTPEAQLAAAIKNKEGKSVIRSFAVEAFSKNFAEKKNELKEEMYAPETKIYGDLALVWGRYVFFVDGKISHCGVNAFHLVRTETGWKIANASTTIEPQGCTEQEKAIKVAAPSTTTKQ